MREDFIEELIKDVYGPRKGPNEIIEDIPISEYLTGVLVPEKENRTSNRDPDEESITENNTGSPDEGTSNDDIGSLIPSELDPSQRIRSFGISFVVESTNPKLDLCITWARYFQVVDEDNDDEGTDLKYERKPYYKIFKDIDVTKSQKLSVEDNTSEKNLELYIKPRVLKDNQFNIMISLVNVLKDTEDYLDCSDTIFQPSLRINHTGDLPNLHQESFEDDSLEFIYRDRKIKARGHMCAAIWREIDYMDQFEVESLWPDGLHFMSIDDDIKNFVCPKLRTEFVPMHPMPLPSFDMWDNDLIDENLYNKYNEELLKAKNLSEMWDIEDIDRELSPIVKEYSDWIESQENSLVEGYEEISSKIVKNQKKARDRIKEGIEILKRDEKARLAFCFANKTILIQHNWKKKDREFKWRGFQIAFFLMNIESIINPSSEYRDVLDLLWISTGGGKTESYLAIMAFTIAYRRLTNENYGGTSIISRYTLRLLTIQQFSRTLSLITAAEYLRVFKSNGKIGWRPQKCNMDSDWIYGTLRFSLGMWVGSSVTPNQLLYKKIDDGYTAISILKTSSPKKSSSNPAQIVQCPICGNVLSIQENGIPKEKSIFIVVEVKNGTIDDFCNILDGLEFIESSEYSNENHEMGFYTVELKFNIDIEYDHLEKLDNLFDDNCKLASLNIYNIGYFGVNETEGTIYTKYTDFEIFCTDPNCKLNSNVFWKEGHPIEGTLKLDNYYDRVIKTPFKHSTRIPIPAYTVDDQIYSKCPTVIIGTADKIARIAYENRISTIFGNVSLYNEYYGYLKDEDSFPKNIMTSYTHDNVSVDNFLPPDLIIQDELHLIDGPLGSLFGIYEATLNAIIKVNGGNPKYIASSATIKNAKNQSKLLFAKNLYQFPPYGLNVEDNFFVKERPLKEAWDENNRGRVYMGIYSPGRGPMTPLVHIWARMLNTSNNHIGEDFIKYYWTIVGYYNAIRELGGGIALFREDIGERFKNLSGKDHVSNKFIQLSGRMASTEVPLELNKIENDGYIENYENPKYNAIFTTSMFGTGVDISHLSLMVLNGQPKTTGSYIQASGRIGREHGGLVVTFLKAGRPRDLSHYEMFSTYHYKFQTSVEPVSVSPFSKGALDKAIGATIVAFLRNSVNMKFNWDLEPIPTLNESSTEDYNILRNKLNERLDFIFSDENNIENILGRFDEAFEKWLHDSKEEIDYFYSDKSKNRKNVVLGSAFHEHNKQKFKAIYKKVPNSLREVEETTMFWV